MSTTHKTLESIVLLPGRNDVVVLVIDYDGKGERVKNDYSLQIAEEFDSVQGEGRWTGTAMRFIRLAGCNVGKLHKGNMRNEKTVMLSGKQATFPGEAYHATCTLWDGRTFACDTNYQKHYEKEMIELLRSAWQNHICITGGEPLIHSNLDKFFSMALMGGYYVHLETSGTRHPEWLDKFAEAECFWMSVSPKQYALESVITLADEIKILVDEKFDIGKLTLDVLGHENVYLQPVNDEMTVDRQNLERCLEIQKKFPEFKLSVQMHKFMNVR